MDVVLDKVLSELATELVPQIAEKISDLVENGKLTEKDLLKAANEEMISRGVSAPERASWLLLNYVGFTKEEIHQTLQAECPTCPAPGEPTEPIEPVPQDPPTELQDVVDPTTIRCLDPTAAAALSWPVVSPLTVSVSGGRMNFGYSNYPGTTCNVSGKALGGNFWIGRKVGSEWIMAPFEWFYPNQMWAGPINWSDPGHSVNGGFTAPNAGENLIFMISGCARCGARSTSWRTAICRGVWG